MYFLFDDKMLEHLYFPTWWENPRIDDCWKSTTALYIMDAFRWVFGSVEESLKTCYFVYGETSLLTYVYIKNRNYGRMISIPNFATSKDNSSTSSWYQEIRNKRKRKRSDSVLWQKPLHQQKCQKDKVKTQTMQQKSSNTQRLRTDLGRSVGVTTVTQLMWLIGLRAQSSHFPQHPCNQRIVKLRGTTLLFIHKVISLFAKGWYHLISNGDGFGNIRWYHLISMWYHIIADWYHFIQRWSHLISRWYHLITRWYHLDH